MAGYRRFVAYVYEYRKGKKENNCGFIKVEVRDDQCRMEMHLQCPGLTPEAECRIYGFMRSGGLMESYLLGRCKTAQGRADGAFETDSRSMGGSGISLNRMGGMIIRTENGAFFGTEWDDQPVRPENFKEMEAPAEEIESQSGQNCEQGYETGEIPETEAVKESEEEQESGPEQTETVFLKENEKDQNSGLQTGETEEIQDAEDPDMPAETETPDTAVQEETDAAALEEAGAPDPEEAELETQSVKSLSDAAELGGAGVEQVPDGGAGREQEFYLPFDDDEIRECRKIHPKELTVLLRRDCALRNNRFLQYGYYNFGHLLLGKSPDGQYILGVPGGYDQQERFMANMFGFPYFKESRQIQLPKGRGGYWYRLINAPDAHKRDGAQ